MNAWIYITSCLLVLTVRWHAIALRMVSVRCVWPWGLQGGAVLGLPICSHDTSPASADLGKGRYNEEPFEDKFSFSVSVTTQHHCFSWLEICTRKHSLDDSNGITHLIRLQTKRIHAKLRTQSWREFLQCLA